ncbi:MAG: hypothetical protein K1X94_11180 [Sandaracinaceae bacterium]|nr:hypothetical protein [Sandaracinaceae bacterium]
MLPRVRIVVIAATTALGCTASAAEAPRAATTTPSAPELESSASTPLERARITMNEGAAEAARIAWDARGGEGDSPELRALGARAALAIDCADQAIQLAGETTDPELLRLVVRAHLTRDRWAEAGLIAARPELAGDADAASVVRVARAAEGLSLFQVSGSSCAEARWQLEAPVPVIEVAIDGRRALALLDTTTHVTRVSSAVVSDDGVLASLAIGGVTLGNVPVFSRDLAAAREVATLPIDIVLGRDVLFRWRVAFSRTDAPTVRLGGPALFRWSDRFFPASPIDVIDEAPMEMALEVRGDSHAGTLRPIAQLALDSTQRSYLTIVPTTRAAMEARWDDSDFASGTAHLELATRRLDGDIEVASSLRWPAPVGGVVGWPALAGMQLGWRWLSTLEPSDVERQGVVVTSDLRPCTGHMRSGPRTWYRCRLEPVVETRAVYDPME